MDRTLLVNSLLCTDIATGAIVLDALKQAKVKVSVALWAILPEYEDWRLVLAGMLLAFLLNGRLRLEFCVWTILLSKTCGTPSEKRKTLKVCASAVKWSAIDFYRTPTSIPCGRTS